MKASEIFSTIRDWANGRFIKKSGDQVSGPITMTGVESTGFQSTAGNVDVWMGIGSGGVNHGIYSKTLNKWIAYADSEKVHLLGNADTATLSDRLKNSGSLSSDDAVKSMFKNGVTMTTAYNDGYPTPYGNVLTLRGTSGGLSQLFLGWTGDNSVGKIYYRSMRDMATEWSPWKQIGDGGTINIDNETIQKNAKDQLSVPALSRVFRVQGRGVTDNEIGIDLPIAFSDLKIGDIFICNIDCSEHNLSLPVEQLDILFTDNVNKKALLYTNNNIGSSTNPKRTRPKVYVNTNNTASATYKTKNLSCVWCFGGFDSSGNAVFFDMLNVSVSEEVISAYNNQLHNHYSMKGQIAGTTPVVLKLFMGFQYLLTWEAHTSSNNKIYGHGAQLISVSRDGSANPLRTNLGVSTNSGIALSGVWNGNYWDFTLKPGSSSLTLRYALYLLRDNST